MQNLTEVARHALIVAAVAVTTVAAAPYPASKQVSPDEEREQLRLSLEKACLQPDDDDHWAELDKCHRAWFRNNEEAVWRLKLNPHQGQSAPRS